MNLRPVATEKAVRIIELDNVVTFIADKNSTKDQIKKEVEKLFEVKVARVRTLLRDNKKHAYVKLKKDFPAIDLATKLGLM